MPRVDCFCNTIVSTLVQVTWHEPEPEMPPEISSDARSKIIIRNRRTTIQYIYVNDTSDQSPLESWEEIATLDPGEDSDMEFEEGHLYSFRSIDTTMDDCSGNDPDDRICRRSEAGVFPGHPAGSVVTWTI
jgi:hypothetical protein